MSPHGCCLAVCPSFLSISCTVDMFLKLKPWKQLFRSLNFFAKTKKMLRWSTVSWRQPDISACSQFHFDSVFFPNLPAGSFIPKRCWFLEPIKGLMIWVDGLWRCSFAFCWSVFSEYLLFLISWNQNRRSFKAYSYTSYSVILCPLPAQTAGLYEDAVHSGTLVFKASVLDRVRISE